MKQKLVKFAMWSAVPLLLIGATAVAGDGVDVTIKNDGTQDIVVTVYDMNTEPHGVILSHARINGFTSIPVSLSPGDNGEANVSWIAISVDKTERKCGHANNVALDDSSSIDVHADSACSELSASVQPES